MTDLSERHALFIAEFMRDCNPAAAARRAGFSPRTGSRLMAVPAISDEITRRQAALATEVNVTVRGLVDEAESARKVAEGADNASAMVAATTLKAKLTGLLVERTEDVQRRDEAEREAQQRGELKTAADLIADAAVSLGLPRTATPAQVVGSLAARPIATPEAFLLMRAVDHG